MLVKTSPKQFPNDLARHLDGGQKRLSESDLADHQRRFDHYTRQRRHRSVRR